MLIPKVEDRIKQYIGYLERRKYEKLLDLAIEVYETGEVLRKPPVGVDWRAAPLPYNYGREWTTFWFRTSFTLPAEAAGRQVFLAAVPRADSLVFIDGRPSGAVNPVHEKILLSSSGEAGRKYDIHLESYAGHKYPGEHSVVGGEVILTLGLKLRDYPNVFESASLLVKNEAIYSLYYDAFVLYDLASALDADSLRRNRILRGLYDAFGFLRFDASTAELEEQAAKAALAIRPLMEARNGDSAPQAPIVGHAHIDHAWLWPIWETERKAARTFSNMARYAREFPEFVFIQSQPCQLEIVEREYPAVFEDVKAAYAAGQWEPNGGMWVEADCNLIGGESFVRQFLVGKAATRRMLGYEGDTLWLPDVFGYSAAMPQILRGCGIDYFVTSKINWNDTTRFPYDSFVWRGIDGSEVKTHYITARKDGYNGEVSPARLLDAWHYVQHKEVQEAVISSIGEGDGGGGTKRSDLECARRMADLEGAPKTKWRKVSEALAEIFARPSDLPIWSGELYLELHRGTYTTQALMKRNNRRAEFAMRDCELLCAEWASKSGKGAAAYPRAELLEAWKTVLTLQFHDIIPGSSINRVYRDAEKSYSKLFSDLDRLSGDALRSLAGLGPKPPQGAVATRYALRNALSWERSSLVELQGAGASGAELELASASGEAAPTQALRRIDGSTRLYGLAKLPSMGVAGFELRRAKAAAPSPFRYSVGRLETPFYSVTFDAAMRISSLVEKSSGRELVGKGQLFNELQSAEDMPVRWEAWDIDSDWKRSVKSETRLLSSELVSNGPLFIAIRCRYAIGESSSLVQDLVFRSFDRRVDFVTEVDWSEKHRVLKAAFGTRIATDKVRCEIQFGNVLRDTHTNMPQDRARFEICAHKWICLEEPGSGLALMNDCKYGHDVSGSLMRITLLRSPKAPDATADMGGHRFTYSVLPFEGSFADSDVVRSAYDLNSPLAAVVAGEAPVAASSFLSLSDDRICVESVKLAEASGRSVLRLYETTGAGRKAKLVLGSRIRGAWSCDMLERGEAPLPHGEKELELEFGPFQVRTILLDLEPELKR